MALILRETLCILCNLPLLDSAVVAFPPFVRNEKDVLFVVSDAAVHRACLDTHSLGNRALAALNAVARLNLSCAACGREVGSDADVFDTGLLTSDSAHESHKYNFLRFHREHFATWEHAAEFRTQVSSFVGSQHWAGPGIDFDPFPRWRASRS